MTDEELDLAHEAKEAIDAAIHRLVDDMTANLPPTSDAFVRTLLNDSFRFWRKT